MSSNRKPTRVSPTKRNVRAGLNRATAGARLKGQIIKNVTVSESEPYSGKDWNGTITTVAIELESGDSWSVELRSQIKARAVYLKDRGLETGRFEEWGYDGGKK